MAIERLSFVTDAPPYHAYFAAQHSVRYSLVRDQIKGKRVLDVACGQGFGSYLMAEWGAAQVVGIDIALDAIDAARSLFRNKKVRYILGDATKLDQVIAKEPPFDLIVCFETIEHVSEPVLLLDQLAKYRAPDGIIIISCPNDYIAEDVNPYHTRRFTFEEFRELTTIKLGVASQWLFGVPVVGQMNYLSGDSTAENPGSEPINAIQLRDVSNTFVAPAQENIKPNRANCTYYVGVWGCALTPNAVIAPQSHLAFVEPWQTIEHLEQEIIRFSEVPARFRDKYQLMRRRVIHHAKERNRIAEERNRIAEERNRIVEERNRIVEELNRVSTELARLRQKFTQLRVERALLQVTGRCKKMRLWALVAKTLSREGLGAALKEAWTQRKLNLLVHYIRYGAIEDEDRRLVKASGLFEPAYYLARYADVAGSQIDPLDHYMKWGGGEGRFPGPDFDTAWYLAQYPDIATAKINPLVHYIRYGAIEGRRPNSLSMIR